MSLRTRVDADLCFAVQVPGEEPVHGSIEGRGSLLTLTVSDPSAFAAPGDAETLRRLADGLASRGLQVAVRDQQGRHLLTMGAVRTPWWQRTVTRSRHLRLGGWRGLLPVGRRMANPSRAGLVPPGTPYPVAPTFLRHPVRRARTTHDPHRGGGPRLVELPVPGVTRTDYPVHWLQGERTTIGSDPSCDLVLPGLAPLHAEVLHDDSDEFVLLARDGVVLVHGARVTGERLRTSARIQLGDRLLAYAREEYADHGRPHGGRIGGELGRQLPQPPRPAARPEPAEW